MHVDLSKSSINFSIANEVVTHSYH